ncbi:Transcription elongation factor S-II [Tetrabaena socialis]|uniref:Transcription elongation factor S-II n=1 Tax=Tetrabaena socialis TaxID=47790 RepID=A0A2J7ZJR6_9CHLO|nr:Transcription elongation factor S-II [Tetrabaena socialis]PNH00515.1 Transcription elongation factor S-II [Tetrabaena socialis]|eukprot:PNH00201.1 Transcription elongation factor S-II [Tetrabaena socialis]
MRAQAVQLCKEATGLSDEHAIDLETGIYNWSLQQADAFRVPKTWTNAKFLNIYCSKTTAILANLDPDSYVGNRELLQRVLANRVKPHDLPFMKPQELFPERWRELVELKVQKDEYATTVKPVAMTDQFKCKRCKKRECVYQELQLRSADEPATIIIICISCNHTWRVG